MKSVSQKTDGIRRIRRRCRPLRPLPTGVAPRLPSLADVRAVLFDVYGTMFVSGSGDIGVAAAVPADAALTAALRAAGLRAVAPAAGEVGVRLLTAGICAAHARARRAGVRHPEVEIRDIWRGVLQRLSDQGLVAGRISRALEERVAIEYETRVNPVWPMPGLRAALRALRVQGVLLGVVSNAQFFTPLLFDALLGESAARCGFARARCVWSYAMGEAKPSDRLVAHALANLRKRGIPPGAVLMVGNDVRNDLAPAARQGCRTILFAGDRRSLRWRRDDPSCRGWETDGVLTDLRQLPRLLAARRTQRSCAASERRAALRSDSAGQRAMRSSK